MKKRRKILALMCSMFVLLGCTQGFVVEASEPQNSENLKQEEQIQEESDQEQNLQADTDDVEKTKTQSHGSTSEEAKKGIVQVNTVFEDKNGITHIIASATGFIIGDQEKEQYVITCNHIVNISDEYKEAAFTYLEIPNENDSWSSFSFETKVVVEGDVVLDATYVNSSEELDIAILKLNQPIFTRKPLIFLTSEGYSTDELPYKVGDAVYALGYPGRNSYDTEPVYYSDSQISMAVGSIVNLVGLNDVQTREHNAVIGLNNCGGPRVTEDGDVIGVNTLYTDGVYYIAVDSTKITKILDGLGVAYDKEVSKPVEEEPVTEIPVEKEETGYDPLILMIVCGAIVIATIGAVTVIIVLVTKNGAKEESHKNKKRKDQIENSALAQYQNDVQINKPVMNQINISNSGTSSETMILSNPRGSVDTNVLGGDRTTSGQLKLGTLIRRKSGEQIALNKSYFTIGKDSLHVDYCIKDNGTISRQHAIIRADEKGVLLEDCNSTNGTFINGTRLDGGQAVILRSGDSVRLANEEFEYQAK